MQLNIQKKNLKGKHFQLLKISKDLLNDSLIFFNEKEIFHILLKKDIDCILMIQVSETIGYILRNLPDYTYYTFYMKDFLDAFNKLIEKGYEYEYFDIPKFFEDKDVENSIYQMLYNRNYTRLINIVKENSLVINKFSVKKKESYFVVYRSGALYIDDKNSLLEEFLGIIKDVL